MRNGYVFGINLAKRMEPLSSLLKTGGLLAATAIACNSFAALTSHDLVAEGYCDSSLYCLLRVIHRCPASGRFDCTVCAALYSP
jgi:hypothetical protein